VETFQLIRKLLRGHARAHTHERDIVKHKKGRLKVIYLALKGHIFLCVYKAICYVFRAELKCPPQLPTLPAFEHDPDIFQYCPHIHTSFFYDPFTVILSISSSAFQLEAFHEVQGTKYTVLC
jgi:hypothetical protein